MTDNRGRDDGGDLRLKEIEGRAQRVIVRVYPGDDDRRARAVRAHAPRREAPRRSSEVTLDVPVDQRHQTLLSLTLDEEQRAKVVGAPGPSRNVGRVGERESEALHRSRPEEGASE